MNKIEQLARMLKVAYDNAANSTFTEFQRWRVVAEKVVEELSEKQYRTLNVGDSIQEGDEVWRGFAGWQKTDLPVGQSILGISKYRRPLHTREDANKIIKHLSEVREDQSKQIRDLEGQVTSYKLGYQEACAERNQAVAELTKWEEAYRVRDKDIDKLQAHNETLQKELGLQAQGWGEVIRFIIDNRIGVVGHTFPQIALQTLQNNSAKVVAEQNAKIYELQGALHSAQQNLADKNATILRLREKLENLEPFVGGCNKDHPEMKRRLDQAAIYINALENDLSFYNTVADMFKTKLESAAHGE